MLLNQNLTSPVFSLIMYICVYMPTSTTLGRYQGERLPFGAIYILKEKQIKERAISIHGKFITFVCMYPHA